MEKLTSYGLEIELPEGWDGHIYRRQAEDGEMTRRAMHAANFALPPNVGDYAVGAVDTMRAADMLVVLLEFDPDSAGQGLFKNEGLPTELNPDDFSPSAMPRAVPGRTAAQWFFSLGGRAFCLYVVLGSHRDRASLLPLANTVVSTIRVDE